MCTEKRVVVTGLGMITPLGTGLEINWQRLCKGESGIGLITGFDTSDCRTQIAGEVRNFEPTDFMEKKVARRTGRFIHFAAAASRMALEDSKLSVTPEIADNVGVSVATALGGVDSFEKNHKL
jgi:3-oxoacyl-[acyl-carrier-protein] synthase II